MFSDKMLTLNKYYMKKIEKKEDVCNNFTRNQKIPMPTTKYMTSDHYWLAIFSSIEPLSTDARKQNNHKKTANTLIRTYEIRL